MGRRRRIWGGAVARLALNPSVERGIPPKLRKKKGETEEGKHDNRCK